VESVRSGYRSW